MKFKNLNELNFITPTYIKNIGKDGEVYNYYEIGFDIKTVEDLFEAWKKSDPMVHVYNYEHQFISNVKGYTWGYKFNNRTW